MTSKVYVKGEQGRRKTYKEQEKTVHCDDVVLDAECQQRIKQLDKGGQEPF